VKAAVAALLLAALLAVSSARADVDATTAVLDRTYVCSIPLHGGIYRIESRAHPGARTGRSWTKLAYAGLRSGVFSGGTGNLVAWVTAGKPIATTTVDQEFWTFDVKTFGTVGIRSELCNPSRATFPFTTAGLRGGAAAPLGAEYECEVPRRVLVRVRAVVPSPASLRGREFKSIHMAVREAKLAVRTQGGKPLAYAEVSESGKARLLTAKGCAAQ
jgi:hypothetical protein